MQLWNARDIAQDIKQNGKTVTVPAMGTITFPDDEGTHVLQRMSPYGFIDLPSECTEEQKAQRWQQALTNYYEFCWQQLLDWQSWMDDRRKQGNSVLGLPKRMRELQREVVRLEELLGLDQRMAPEVYDEIARATQRRQQWTQPVAGATTS